MTLVKIIMGSQSDYEIMKNCEEILRQFSIEFESRIVSAHRTPDRLYDFCSEIKNSSTKIIIAGAGGSAHLPGMVASMVTIPVLGVPILTKTLQGLDSLLSIVQMPAGIPVATFAVGEAGAKNAGLMAVEILALNDANLATKLAKFRQEQTAKVAQLPI